MGDFVVETIETGLHFGNTLGDLVALFFENGFARRHGFVTLFQELHIFDECFD